MNIQKIEENISKLSIPSRMDISFVFDLLEVYGKPKSSITRLKLGTYNLSKDPNAVLWKKNIYFQYVQHEDLHSTIDDLRGTRDILRHEPRFIIVTDFEQLLAADIKTQETLDIKIKELPKHFTFFLPWAGMEKASSKTENLADIKAAGRMAKLYDEIRKENPSVEPEFIHSLNVFFSRLLFCFFAEDTDVFQKGLFTNCIASHTQTDGNDLNDYLDRLFESLDKEDKSGYPSHLKSFPYVNGGLFGKRMKSPEFNAQARRILLECGELNWSQINPDIFGSMIQAVVHPSQRESLGMHYTSVVNIMKVIEPLFLEELNEEFDKAYSDEKKLIKLLKRIYELKVFDPACGSGNFLIIAYKELRKLEHRILQRIIELTGKLGLFHISGIKLENFFGIEIDDFAHEIAVLSLWLAKHQMNQEFKELFNISIPLVPLKDAGNIVCANAALIDWNVVCTINDDNEVYLIGNPPYLGNKSQSAEQKSEVKQVFKSTGNYRELDYIAIWFMKAAEYSKAKAKFAFVTTSSINQGSQVEQLWPRVFKNDLEIIFAYLPFNWSNNAKANAGVSCSIIGIQKKSKKAKYIFNEGLKLRADNINGYLINAPDILIQKSLSPISALPPLITGNSPYDGTHLLLSDEEKRQITSDEPEAARFIRRAIGASELMNDIARWCIWIQDSELKDALKVKQIKDRVDRVREWRLGGGEVARGIAYKPHQFRYTHTAKESQIIIPIVSASRRRYLPAGYFDSGAIVIGSASVIYDPEPYVFGVISSLMHFTWVKLTAGRLRHDIRYLSALSYNTFPFPGITSSQKELITRHAFEVLSARENYPEKTLSEMYNPEKMPSDLLAAHKDLDEVIDRIYRTKPFESDEDRLQHLFKMYEEMTANKKEITYA